jgi:hypothetical protein
MKLTKSQLREIIREELTLLNESTYKTSLDQFKKGIENYKKGNILKSQLITMFNGLNPKVQPKVRDMLFKVL